MTEQPDLSLEKETIAHLEKKAAEHHRTACACTSQPMLKMIHEAARDATYEAIKIVRGDYKPC